ncbi:hypothetical protein LIER_26689 [Lithospermum erythrorhizon]|uniref:Glycine-rich protein n=1 Tax=Lithospermum erythrorhizon TaxID=34254 RepID=A0AAV3RAI6_LITER
MVPARVLLVLVSVHFLVVSVAFAQNVKDDEDKHLPVIGIRMPHKGHRGHIGRRPGGRKDCPGGNRGVAAEAPAPAPSGSGESPPASGGEGGDGTGRANGGEGGDGTGANGGEGGDGTGVNGGEGAEAPTISGGEGGGSTSVNGGEGAEAPIASVAGGEDENGSGIWGAIFGEGWGNGGHN